MFVKVVKTIAFIAMCYFGYVAYHSSGITSELNSIGTVLCFLMLFLK